MPQSARRIRLLGREMDVVTREQVMATIAARAAEKRKTLIANHNLHSLRLWDREPAMARLYARAEIVEIDSMPLVAWGRLMGLKLGREHRNTYLDWREDFWRMASAGGLRVFHLGCKPGVGAAAREALLKQYPGAVIGERHGYFDLEGVENEAVLAEIAAFEPDVLFVGMGMPRQERWIEANWDRLPECPLLPIGAAFDYEAGVVPTPPRWTAAIGMEWLARFLAEPGRLFHRYFVEPWGLVPAMARDVAGRFGRKRERFEVAEA